MAKDAVFTMKIEPALREQFMAEAEATHQPASQIVRQLMREFVQKQRETREYEAFLARKVSRARASKAAAQGRPQAVVEAEFAARRGKVRSTV